ASLWNLDDASGAFLVGNLYDQLISPETSKAEALRQAQLTLLNDPDYRAPYFWAAFVLVGNWL
ncbi:MAG: CHAT domain-containing protein, partial [Cyanobacteria bacterium P01_E01_bin.43]